jgi:lysozyme family protein
MTDLVALRAANAKRWTNAKLTRNFSSVASHLVAPNAKGRYQSVEAKTGVPWFVIAVIHERESSQDWTGSLAQGDPWNKVSVHVPAGPIQILGRGGHRRPCELRALCGSQQGLEHRRAAYDARAV